MATYTLKQFVPVTTLGTSATTLYTVSTPATNATIKQILIANYSSSSASVTVYAVPGGGTASNSNVIVPAIPIAANSTITLDVTQVLPVNAFISAFASAGSSLNIMISGYEVQ